MSDVQIVTAGTPGAHSHPVSQPVPTDHVLMAKQNLVSVIRDLVLGKPFADKHEFMLQQLIEAAGHLNKLKT